MTVNSGEWIEIQKVKDSLKTLSRLSVDTALAVVEVHLDAVECSSNPKLALLRKRFVSLCDCQGKQAADGYQ